MFESSGPALADPPEVDWEQLAALDPDGDGWDAAWVGGSEVLDRAPPDLAPDVQWDLVLDVPVDGVPDAPPVDVVWECVRRLGCELGGAGALAELGDDAALGVLADCERLLGFVQAVQVRVLARFAALRSAGDGVSEFAADEVAAELGLTRTAAANRVALALDLAGRLPGTLAALERGEIDVVKARMLAEVTRPLPAAQAGLVERWALARAPGRTVTQLRAIARRAVLRADPDGGRRRHEARVLDRRLEVRGREDGMADLYAYLRADQTVAIYRRIDALACRARVAGDNRTADQRRADVFADLLLGGTGVAAAGLLGGIPVGPASAGAADAGAAGTGAAGGREAGGREAGGGAAGAGPATSCAGIGVRTAAGTTGGWYTRPGASGAAPTDAVPTDAATTGAATAGAGVTGTGAAGADDPAPPIPPAGAAPVGAQVQVTVAAGTLLGFDEQPGELAGYGPIPATLARELAADGVWRRLLTDPASGVLLDYGRTTYRVPAGLADHVRARHGRCAFPGCRQPARRCDLDHTVRYPDGPTSDRNLAPLCRHHHRLKSEARWSVSQPEPGTLTWTSPTGRRYTTRPEPLTDPDPPPGGGRSRSAAEAAPPSSSPARTATR